MKKLLSILMLAALLLSLVACGGDIIDGTTDAATTDAPTTEEPTTEAATTEAATTEEATTEASSTEPEKFVYKHVVIVGIDGMGAYHKGADTPNMDAIFADYALTDVAQTYNPVASGPSWMSMITGVDPREMKTTTNVGYTATINSKYEAALEKYATLFRLVHDKYNDASIASITGFADMQNVMWPDEEYLYKEMNYTEWWSVEENTEKALDYIEGLDTSKPSFTFIYYTEPDSTGHKSGWGSAEFNAMLTKCDAELGKIFAAVEAKGMLEDTLFIMATDHGGKGKDHGMVLEPEALDITLGFRGKTVTNAKDFDMIFRDIAAIVVEGMGLERDPQWSKLREPAPVVPAELFTKE